MLKQTNALRCRPSPDRPGAWHLRPLYAKGPQRGPQAMEVASDFAEGGINDFRTVRQPSKGIVSKQGRGLNLEHFTNGGRDLADFRFGELVAAELDEVPPGAGVGCHEDLGLGCVG